MVFPTMAQNIASSKPSLGAIKRTFNVGLLYFLQGLWNKLSKNLETQLQENVGISRYAFLPFREILLFNKEPLFPF